MVHGFRYWLFHAQVDRSITEAGGRVALGSWVFIESGFLGFLFSGFYRFGDVGIGEGIFVLCSRF